MRSNCPDRWKSESMVTVMGSNILASHWDAARASGQSKRIKAPKLVDNDIQGNGRGKNEATTQ